MKKLMSYGNQKGASLKLIGLVRGLRTAILVPILLALSLYIIKNELVANFAVYGTFAHLALVIYPQSRIRRLAILSVLSVSGILIIILGVLASQNSIFAVIATLIVIFGIQLAGTINELIALLRNALMLAFMLAVSSPSPLINMGFYTVGWIIAAILSTLILLLSWIPGVSPKPVITKNISAQLFISSSRMALAMGLGLIIARFWAFEHPFWIFIGVATLLVINDTPSDSRFLQQQAGNIIGFILSAIFIAFFSTYSPILFWAILVVAVFLCVYTVTLNNFLFSQIFFTIFVVFLYSIISAKTYLMIGIVRVDEIALDGTISLLMCFISSYHQFESKEEPDK